MDLRHLRSFLAVYEARGFRAAAEAEHLTQSAVSRHIGVIEQSLGVSLFARTPSGAVPTPDGERFHARVAEPLRDLLHALEQARLTARSGAELQIAYIPPAVRSPVPALMRHVRADHPHAVVRLDERTSAGVLSAVRSGHADVGFLAADGDYPDLVVSPLARLDYLIALSTTDVLADGSEVALQDLDGRVLITPGDAEPVHARIVEFVRSHAPSVRTQTALRFHEVHGLVSAGVGVAAVPPLPGDAVPPDITLLRPVPALPSATLAMVVRRGWRSPVARAVGRFRDSWTAPDLRRPDE